MAKGKLYLIPSTLSDGPVGVVLPEGTLALVRRLDCFIVEEIRSARRFLIKAGMEKPIDSLIFKIFNEHSGKEDLFGYLDQTMNGLDTGLLSEAGVPCVADPGSLIVRTAHELGIRVVPLTGPSSILLALMASGFNGQNFVFHGYFPVDKSLRMKRIKEIDRMLREKDQTHIFIETPYRNLQMLESLTALCSPDTMLCIATDITGMSESIRTMRIAEWRNQKPDIHKKPVIFLLYR
jgi:16S rRNA (cytidine1402-2'-O)-methyltransferase